MSKIILVPEGYWNRVAVIVTIKITAATIIAAARANFTGFSFNVSSFFMLYRGGRGFYKFLK